MSRNQGQARGAYARAGYVLARVSVPDQKLNDHGVLRIVVVDGFVEKVEVDNAPDFLADGNAAEPLNPGWRKCLPGGCIADALLKDDMVQRWKTPMKAGHITWTDAAGRDLQIVPSFRVLSPALDALNKDL
jgi:POTRA domain, ShlB-type